MIRTALLLAFLVCAPDCALFAQKQYYFSGVAVTGQLNLTATVNVLQLAQGQAVRAAARTGGVQRPEFKIVPELGIPSAPKAALASRFAELAAVQTMPSLGIVPASASFGFDGLTHLDQRMANGGNQFSVEPPSPSIATASGYIVEGVNNAIQVYTTAGVPLLPKVLATDQLFALPAEINRVTGVNGVYPTDIRVFYDQTIDRWFILQRAQDNDATGQPLNSSHLYIAASQTGDPTGTYNIYTIHTTDAQNSRCPCLADYPQIGADRYGIHIAANEYDTAYNNFLDATILSISKSSLAAGVHSPVAYRFSIPLNTGYEFALQPAQTPPGASYFLANGGVEYLVSSQSTYLPDSNLAVWALGNTSSLGSNAPNLTLTQTVVPSLAYSSPDVATQRPGPTPYGSSLGGRLPVIDGGDTRVLSATYSGGRLYATFATKVTDENGKTLVGGAYAILSPTLRAGVLAAPTLRQGYLLVKNNHLLRPAIGINAKGNGAIAFTLVGPDYYPSAAFVPIGTLSTGLAIQIVGPGAAPEDGFTAYQGDGVARWGDYATAVAGADGTIWMSTEYIPNAPRTQAANWGTFVFNYIP